MLHLEAQIAAARRTPAEAATVMAGVEEAATAKLRDLRSALADRSDLRAVFLDLFPEGLTFTPIEAGGGRRAPRLDNRRRGRHSRTARGGWPRAVRLAW
jgi:hypothetical protein